jgi:hypothetical protein
MTPAGVPQLKIGHSSKTFMLTDTFGGNYPGAGVFVATWEAGRYGTGLILVENAGTLYRLGSSVTRPFDSSNFATELAAGTWIAISGAGGGISPYNNATLYAYDAAKPVIVLQALSGKQMLWALKSSVSAPAATRNTPDLTAGSHWEPVGGSSPDTATVAEMNTGTDNTKFATPLNLEGSKYLGQSGSKVSATASGTNAYTATIAPAITAYVNTQRWFIRFTNSNTGTSPTLSLNSLAAVNMVKPGGAAWQVGEIPAGGVLLVAHDGTNFQVLSGLAPDLTKQVVKEYYFEIPDAGIADTPEKLFWNKVTVETTNGLVYDTAVFSAVAIQARTLAGSWTTYATIADLNTFIGSTGGAKYKVRLVPTLVAGASGRVDIILRAKDNY